ncbi:MAG: hypothetical protein SFV15_08185 [Polyangiaceae bacterium]|nr:hypothetical protein [Polyangiaceae bacterium]
MNHTIRKIAGGAIVIGVLSPPLTGLAGEGIQPIRRPPLLNSNLDHLGAPTMAARVAIGSAWVLKISA